MSPSGWQLWIDTGGTFTDCLALDPGGVIHRVKVLSSGALRGKVKSLEGATAVRIESNWRAAKDGVSGYCLQLLDGPGTERFTIISFDPESEVIELDRPLEAKDVEGATFQITSPEEAPLLAARLAIGTRPGLPLPPVALRLATTLGTNALLQRRGAPFALFITEGFGDLLRIGTQQRPELFALEIQRPEPLYHCVVEVDERVTADGTVLRPLQEHAVRTAARRLAEDGVRVAAVALANSYANPVHEQQVGRLLLEEGLDHVSCSAALSPLITLLTRAETAAVDAYLTPVVSTFLERVERAAAGKLRVMTSAGGMVSAGSFRAKDCLLSGPAGGVVGAALAGRRAGFSKVISFDMGGTSTDVARYDGDFDYCFEQRVGDARLATPAMAIETVAAGGGSICGFFHGALQVGPASAGADPGPACYGAGGPLTLTDVNLLLGRLDPQRFGIPVSRQRAAGSLASVREAVQRETGQSITTEALLEGFLEIANERMADAIRKISLRRGYEPKDHVLVAFGGAGPQHACGVADRLQMETILVPLDAGLLSALGIGHAPVEKIRERQVLRRLDEVQHELPRWLDRLAAEAAEAVIADGVAADQVEVRRRIVSLRYVGQDTSLQVDVVPTQSLAEGFAERFLALYGHRPEGRPIEVESVRVIAASAGVEIDSSPGETVVRLSTKQAGEVRAYFGGAWQQVPCFERGALKPGDLLGRSGPAVVMDLHSTLIKEPGWAARVNPCGGIVLHREREHEETAAPHLPGRRAAPVQLELFVGRMSATAEEMGELLRRTALSTNIKERRDFSCALLDARGQLVVNAPHIPVHLGSLGLCVRRLKEALSLGPGDVAVTNHPAFGGSHLPDVTVVTPVHHGPSGELVGYVASRAHHAEIGGITPGSMPPGATRLAEEGVVIPPSHLVSSGQPRWDELQRRLEQAPFPSRAVQDNLADIRAAVAANHLGACALRGLAESLGPASVRRFMDALQARGERRIRRALQALPDGSYLGQGFLDDGSPLAVRVTITGDEASIDLSGSAPVHPGNLNATPAIVHGVVIYVLRLLVDRPLPLNEGMMRAISLQIPSGLLDPPFEGDPERLPAVMGGNVETSQRLTDLLLRTLKMAACSQGTMNNVVFGTQHFGYYETVGGGTGAGPGFDGESAVHSHMTNTRITDVEVLEHRYPVRLERFAIRRDSGGQGRFRGGDGTIREYTFLEPVTLSILSQRRASGPCGLEGGGRGKPGSQRVIRSSGEIEELSAIDGRAMRPGDRLLLETPGGGGYGGEAG